MSRCVTRFGSLLALALLAGATALPSVAPAQAPAAKPKALVEFGWDEPDTAYMRRHVARMEETPFDGCVYHADARTPSGEVDSLTWKFWGRRAFADSELAQA